MKNKIYSLLFAILTLIALAADYVKSDDLLAISKPLSIVLLLAWLYQAERLKGRFHKQIFIGLCVALVGDVYAAFAANTYIETVVFFTQFICYLFYLRAFRLDHKSNPKQKNGYLIWAIIGFATFCAGIFFYLQPQLGPQQAAVLIYTLTLCFMGIMAVNRFKKVNLLSFKMIFYASLFFLFANTVWAIDRFVQPIVESSALVIAGYFIAQYLMVYGTIVRKLLVTKTEV
ncbi:putative membrane protein YhhN [Pedobacter sp. UYP30]|uniref:lysoplasmalogenase n=1 Tax=Pedobacter sp. UYP30 TaxID=1756400 RepID=UPI00339B8258